MKSTKNLKYGGYAVIVTLSGVIGLIILNLIFQQISPQFDLTANKLFSLSEQTIQVTEALKSPVTIYGLWEPGKEMRNVREILDRYTAQSDNIRLESIDPDKNPGFITEYDTDKRGIEKNSLIITGERGFKVIRLQDMYDINYSDPQNPQITGFSIERRITSALLYVSSGETPAVYEITGHQETPLGEYMQELLDRENTVLRQVNLIQADIPDDASALILNGPKSDLFPGERDKILEYLDGGGRLLALLDFRARDTVNLDEMFASYGIRFDYGVVVELDKNYNTGHPFQTVPDMGSHEITAPLLRNRTAVILQFARGISPVEARRRTLEISPFLSTSQLSYLRKDISQNSLEIIDSDTPGPIVIGMSAKDIQEGANNQEARVVAIGCANLLEPLELYGPIPANIDLFLNSLTWLRDRPENLAVRSKSLIAFPMSLTGVHVIVFGLLFVVLIPLAFFTIGFVTWLRRRHL
jgi:ABC-type uncharacterized transport system involved in gliding motility auxiliary subunit